MEVIEIFIKLLESPNSLKYYKELERYYTSNNLKEEADGIRFLINKKFNDNNSSDSTK